MNGRQAAKVAAQRIDELEYTIMRHIVDTRNYVACIHDMIEGKSPCAYCEEHEECQLEAKDNKGCAEWWLRFPKESELNAGERTGTETGKSC